MSLTCIRSEGHPRRALPVDVVRHVAPRRGCGSTLNPLTCHKRLRSLTCSYKRTGAPGPRPVLDARKSSRSCCAASAQHGLRHLPARRGKRLRSCACLHLPARPGSSGGRSVRSCGRRRTAAASKSHLVEVACELAALDPARGSKPGSNSRTRRAPRWRPRPTPEGTRFLFSASKDLLHVEALSSLN